MTPPFPLLLLRFLLVFSRDALAQPQGLRVSNADFTRSRRKSTWFNLPF